MNVISYNRHVYNPPHPRKLRTVEEGVKGSQGQPGHGLYNDLLRISHGHCE